MSRIHTPATVEASPAAAQPLLAAVKKQIGSVPNLFRVIANSPAALEGYLGLNAALAKGAPVIVTGHVYTSEYEDRDGNRRSSLEMRAIAVGPDLSRAFVRIEKPGYTGPDAAQNPEAPSTTAPVSEGDGPAPAGETDAGRPSLSVSA